MKKLTALQLSEIKTKNYIPDEYLDAYLEGKNWEYIDSEGNRSKGEKK